MSTGYERTVGRLQQLLKYRTELETTFGKLGADTLRDAARIMICHMEALQADQQVNVTANERQRIYAALNTVKSYCLDKPITVYAIDFIKEFTLLMYNWNVNVNKNRTVEKDIRLIRNIIEMKTTIDESIQLLKRLIEKAKRTANYMPPAFEMSKHYLQILQRKIEAETED